MLELQYGVTISPVLYGKDEYDMRKTFGFCKNVEMEGVSQCVGHAYECLLNSQTGKVRR